MSRGLGSFVVDRRPLAIPAFRRLWTASVVSAVGGSFSLVAVPTQLFAHSGSSATVGLASTISLVTLVIAALSAGTLADAVDRRRLLLGGHAGLGATYLALWLNALLGVDSVAVLLVLVALQGISFGATMTTIGRADADKAGVQVTGGRDQLVRTGNGVIRVSSARADRLNVGGIERSDVGLHVAENEDLNVLGMNFLSSLDRWGVEGRWLILKP